MPKLPEDEEQQQQRHWLYPYISQTRQSIQQTWNEQKDRRSRIIRTFETGKAHTQGIILIRISS